MKWWESATFYEIYLRSFADGNGDGVGDLIGLRSRLEYLKWLGVNALWITPFYPSPMADHGYDVSDYRSVDPLFGSIEDIDGVIEDAHRINMRVIVDFVPNHTSDRHPWFQNAVSDPGHPDRDKYIFRDPAPDGGPPNNWVSVFGGPAWSLDERSGQYYLHLFAPEQPDLNWRNPEVHEYFDETLKFWLDRGIDGFRIDVAHGLFKDEQLRDQPNTETPIRAIDQLYAFDQPEVHDVYRRWRRIVDSYPGDRVLVGEVFIRDPKRVASYVRSDELHLAFNFFLLGQPWDSRRMRPAIEMSMAELGEVGARVTWVLSNHDLTRHPTRYGGGETGLRRARAAVPFLLALPGAVFLYQGEELGLEEALVPDHLRADPIFLRTRGQMAGRDGCRIPIPWEEQSPGYGFSSAEPWLPAPSEWGLRSISTLSRDPDSILQLYRRAIELRTSVGPIQDGDFRWMDAPEGCLVFERVNGRRLICACNFSGEPVHLDLPGKLLLASTVEVVNGDGLSLPADSSAWLIAS